MGLVVGLKISFPGYLQSPGKVSPPSSFLGTFSKEAEPVKKAEALCSDKGSRQELPYLGDHQDRIYIDQLSLYSNIELFVSFFIKLNCSIKKWSRAVPS